MACLAGGACNVFPRLACVGALPLVCVSQGSPPAAARRRNSFENPTGVGGVKTRLSPRPRSRILVPTMPFPALNANAVITCTHMGKVTVIPKLPTVTIGGAPALRLTDLLGSLIACAVPPSPSSKPCLTVVAPPPLWASKTVTVGGLPLLIQNPIPSGTTDGVPPLPDKGLMCSFSGAPTVLIGS
jgi:hypothetical protein